MSNLFDNYPNGASVLQFGESSIQALERWRYGVSSANNSQVIRLLTISILELDERLKEMKGAKE